MACLGMKPAQSPSCICHKELVYRIGKASPAKGGYWMYKTIHSSSSHVRETFWRLNTKNKFRDNKMGEFDFPNLKRI